MKVYFIVVGLLFSLSVLVIPITKADCYTIDSQMNCSSLKGNYREVNNNQCTEYVSNQSVCCCSESIISEAKPKYLLIASVVAFFAILTALVFFYRKNE